MAIDHYFVGTPPKNVAVTFTVTMQVEVTKRTRIGGFIAAQPFGLDAYDLNKVEDVISTDGVVALKCS